jgi:soluble lytic murein transglycosylase-like protein
MLLPQFLMHASELIHKLPEVAAQTGGIRPANWWAAAMVLLAAFLSGCAGLPASVPADAANATGKPASAVPPAPTAGAARAARMQAMTARDILQEWGVFGLEPKPRKKGRLSGLAAVPADSGLPYSASIQDIVANTTCRSCEQRPYHQLVQQAADLHGVPSSLIHAVIQKESRYQSRARSRKNARGLMQLTPDTARFVGVGNSASLFDPQTNINAGTAYLKYLMQTHETVDQVLAAYNSGPGNVRKYKGVPPFSETRRYVSDVKKFYALTSQDLL